MEFFVSLAHFGLALVKCFPNMFNSLSLGEWLGQSRHPPRSVLRPILVLINFSGLRPFFLSHLQCDAMEFSTRQRVQFFFDIDETCFFT